MNNYNDRQLEWQHVLQALLSQTRSITVSQSRWVGGLREWSARDANKEERLGVGRWQEWRGVAARGWLEEVCVCVNVWAKKWVRGSREDEDGGWGQSQRRRQTSSVHVVFAVTVFTLRCRSLCRQQWGRAWQLYHANFTLKRPSSQVGGELCTCWAMLRRDGPSAATQPSFSRAPTPPTVRGRWPTTARREGEMRF